MKTVRDVCELQPNALSIKLSDQVEQLDELIGGEGDGTAFFERTHITQGMQDLVSEGIARLAGASSQAVFHLKQAMGGGKTHVLVGFGLLAKHAALRKNVLRGSYHMPNAFEGALPSPRLMAATARITFSGVRSPSSSTKAMNSVPSGRRDRRLPDENDWLDIIRRRPVQS